MSEQESSLRYRDPVDARGFVILSGAVLVDRELSDGAKVTYLLLLDYARQDEACWPGQATLAAERGIKERAIRNHLTELEQRGLITIEQRGLRKTNVYWIENVQRVYGQSERKRPLDRQKNADPDRHFFAGQERQKNADKEDTVGNIHRGKRGTLNVDARVEVTEKPTFQRSTSNENESDIYAVRDRAVQEVIALTGDEGSQKRFEQLWEIAEAKNVLVAWKTAFQATKRRMNATNQKPLERPGAYFDSICVRELEKREVFVPTNADKQADVGVGAIIRQQLFMDEENPVIDDTPNPKRQVVQIKETVTDEALAAELAKLDSQGGEAHASFMNFYTEERNKYEAELGNLSQSSRDRLLAVFDRSDKRIGLYRKWREIGRPSS